MALQAGIPYTLTSASANNPTAYLSKKTDVRGDAYYYGGAKVNSGAKWELQFENQPDGTTMSSIQDKDSGLYLGYTSLDVTTSLGKLQVRSNANVPLKGVNDPSAKWIIISAFGSDPAEGLFEIVAPPIDLLPGEHVVGMDADSNLVLAPLDSSQSQAWSFNL